MNRHVALTPRSDLHRAMPSTTGLRLDQAHAALASRYWEFLSALFALPPAARARALRTPGSH